MAVTYLILIFSFISLIFLLASAFIFIYFRFVYDIDESVGSPKVRCCPFLCRLPEMDRFQPILNLSLGMFSILKEYNTFNLETPEILIHFVVHPLL